jgi:hypothetical protein
MAVGLEMDPYFADSVEHLNGLIFMARVAWQSSSGKCADVAQTFQFVGRMHQAAAVAQRDNPTDRLQISEDGIP